MSSENSHTAFKKLSQPERLELIMSLSGTLSLDKPAKQLLRIIFEDKSEDFYIRKQALSAILHFSLLKQIRVEGIVDLLLDVDNSENEFIILATIQCSTKFLNLYKEEFSEWLESMANHSNTEIRSEAFTALGKMYLFNAFYPTSKLDYISDLKIAKENFQFAEAEIENRIDATLFKLICDLLLSISTNESLRIELANVAIKELLWEYIQYNTKTEETVFFVNIFNPLAVIVKIYRSSPINWIDFKSELNDFLVSYLEFEVKLMSESLFSKEFHYDYRSFLKNQVVDELFLDRFQGELSKLTRIKKEGLLENDAQTQFVDQLIENIILSDKKKEAPENIALITKFSNAFPSADLNKIRSDLSKINANDPLALSSIFFQYQVQHNTHVALKTGYSQGDLILNDVSQIIRERLPLYDPFKFKEFVLVLSDLIKYFILSQRGGKDRFPYLFQADSKEKDLQIHLLSFLQFSERAEYYLPEVKEIADGGRVDIIYHRDLIQLPIEIKRSFTQLSWDAIRQNYLSQAQTYARTRDQLAFFIVLDLSEKTLSSPLPNTRDLYRVIHLETDSTLDIAYPDCVIAFVIPGNKPLPSERSSYK